MSTVIKVALIVIGIIFAIASSFGMTALIYYGICWAFEWTFTWKCAFGVWLVLSLVSMVSNGVSSKK